MRKLAIIILSLIVSYSALAQEKIAANKEVKESYIIRYVNQPTNSQKITNFFIRDIAQFANKNIQNVSYTCNFTVSANVIKKNNYKNKLEISIKDLICQGDVVYRDFNIQEKLSPATYHYKVIVFKGRGENKKFFLEENLELEILNNNDLFAKINFIDSAENQNYTIKINNTFIDYTDDCKKPFKRIKRKIDSYYEADDILRQSIINIQAINLNNINNLSLYDIQLDEIEQQINILESEKFEQKLKLSTYDPIQYIDRYKQLSRKLTKKRDALNLLLSTLDQVYYNEALKSLGIGDNNTARHYLNKSLEFNPFFCPSVYEIARLNFIDGNLQASKFAIKDALERMNCDPISRNKISSLANSIYTYYLSMGNDAIITERYIDALNILDEGVNFCRSIPGMQCSQEIFNAIYRAKSGMCNSFLSMSQQSIDNGQVKYAENYLLNAIDYQAKNRDIDMTSKISLVQNNLYNMYINIAYNDLANSNYNQSIKFLNKADSMCSYITSNCQAVNNGFNSAINGIYNTYIEEASFNFSQSNYSQCEIILNQASSFQQSNSNYINTTIGVDTLMSRVQEVKYHDNIQNGLSYMNSSQYTNAFNLFLKAEALSQQYSFSIDNMLSTYTRNACEPMILNKISEASREVTSNDLTSAQTLYNEANQLYNDYFKGLQNSQIEYELGQLQKNIFNQECVNVQNEYDRQYYEAVKAINNKEYLIGEVNAKSAISYAAQNTSCNINTSNSQQILNENSDIFNYYHLLDDGEKEYIARKYNDCIRKYETASQYYDNNNLIYKGISHINQLDYIKSKGNNFIYWASNYYLNNNDYVNCLDLLHLLNSRGYARGYTKDIQYKLGVKLALRDANINKKDNPKIKVLDYTNGDAFFKYLKKKYVKTFKKA